MCHRNVILLGSRGIRNSSLKSLITWFLMITAFPPVTWGNPGPTAVQGATTEEVLTKFNPLVVLPQIGDDPGIGATPASDDDVERPKPLTTRPAPFQVPEIVISPENLTVSIGSDVILKCVARDPSNPDKRVTITWFKDGDHRIQQSASPRIHFHQGKKKLKIDAVQWSDRGRYECMASNAYGFVRSYPGQLNVEKAVAILRGIRSMNVSRGTVVNSTCLVEGFPEPTVFWEVNGLPYRVPGTNRAYDRQYFLYPAQRTIRLACKTVNNVSTIGETRRKSTGIIFVTNPASYCKAYNGYNCAPHGLGHVFVSGTLDNPGGTLERIVSEVVASMDQLGVPGRCRRAFRSLLCHSAFPACDQRDPDHLKPTSICVEDCVAVKEVMCRDHWEALRSIHSGLLQAYPTFPNCSARPFVATEGACARTAYFDASPSSRKTVNCIIKSGHTYIGKQNITENGSYCQIWDQEFYRSLGYSDVAFTELDGAHNYCRNPGGLSERPWCFVRKRTTEKQYCTIPLCDGFEEFTSPRTQDDSQGSGQKIPSRPHVTDPSYIVPLLRDDVSINTSGFLLIILSALVILLALVIVIGLSIRRVRFLKRFPPYIFPRGFDLRRVPDNRMFGKSFSRSYNPALEHLEYPRNGIIYVADIGEGAFGRVFKATTVDRSLPDQEIPVAVKMLKSSASSQVMGDFDREAVLMSGFSNVNVIKLWGVCFVGRPLCILLEFMEEGDLQEYLQSRNPRNPQFFGREEEELDTKTMTGISVKLLVSFARQAANGMVYLSDRRLVHRDVATRNCLVNVRFQVKIADFGLARYLAPGTEHHTGSREERVPVRWTAPEALWDYRFTTSSDVWSYGVFVWELFSYAEQPYGGMTLEEVFLETQRGYQLPRPENTPSPLYALITDCWHLDPPSRPSFQTLNSWLTDLETEFLRAARLSSIGTLAEVDEEEV